MLIPFSNFLSLYERKSAVLLKVKALRKGWPWASQVALVVKNLPANSGDFRDEGSNLGQEDPLEEGMATHSSILSWRIPMDRGAWWATVHEVAESDMTEATERARLNI